MIELTESICTAVVQIMQPFRNNVDVNCPPNVTCSVCIYLKNIWKKHFSLRYIMEIRNDLKLINM